MSVTFYHVNTLQRELLRNWRRPCQYLQVFEGRSKWKSPCLHLRRCLQTYQICERKLATSRCQLRTNTKRFCQGYILPGHCSTSVERWFRWDFSGVTRCVGERFHIHRPGHPLPSPIGVHPHPGNYPPILVVVQLHVPNRFARRVCGQPAAHGFESGVRQLSLLTRPSGGNRRRVLFVAETSTPYQSSASLCGAQSAKRISSP